MMCFRNLLLSVQWFYNGIRKSNFEQKEQLEEEEEEEEEKEEENRTGRRE